MKRSSSGRPLQSRSRPQYADDYIASKQKAFDALVAEGATIRDRGKFIEATFVEKNRKIRILDYNQMNPATICTDYLLPRKDLSQFVLGNWAKHIFIPSLKDGIAEGIFMFGIGRMFSTYNDIGVQVGTDADINIIVQNGRRPDALKYLEGKLLDFKKAMLERFGIVIEINPAFTILSEAEVVKNISNGDGRKISASKLFYKANEKSIYIIKDHDEIRASVFSKVEDLPDGLLFEHFLGLGSAKPSLMKIRMDKTPLPLVADGTEEPIKVRNVIGSAAFGRYCRLLFPRELFVPPPDWIFSMKYFVNRVYDYVCAMRNLGYSLAQIGFDSVIGPDPDYVFVQNAHRMMLFLQELIQLNDSTFGASPDYSYMSCSRFLRLAEIRGEKFRRDFGELILGGDLLQHSNQAKYASLKAKVEARSPDRVAKFKHEAFAALPKDLHYELVDKNESGIKIRIPYSWADLGFFAFSVIASRVVRIVDTRLYPAYAESLLIEKL